MVKGKVKVVLMEDLLVDPKLSSIPEVLERRRAMLEKVYSMGTVVDKGEFKSSFYFIIGE